MSSFLSVYGQKETGEPSFAAFSWTFLPELKWGSRSETTEGKENQTVQFLRAGQGDGSVRNSLGCFEIFYNYEERQRRQKEALPVSPGKAPPGKSHRCLLIFSLIYTETEIEFVLQNPGGREGTTYNCGQSLTIL